MICVISVDGYRYKQAVALGISDRNLGSLAEAPGGNFEGGRRAGGICLGDEA